MAIEFRCSPPELGINGKSQQPLFNFNASVTRKSRLEDLQVKKRESF